MQKEIDIGFLELEGGQVLQRDVTRELRPTIPALIVLIGFILVLLLYFWYRSENVVKDSYSSGLFLTTIVFLIVLGAWLYTDRATFNLNDRTFRFEKGIRPMVEIHKGSMSSIKTLTLRGGDADSRMPMVFYVTIQWQKKYEPEVTICSYSGGSRSLMKSLVSVDQKFVALATRLGLPYENLAFPSSHSSTLTSENEELRSSP